MAARAMVALLSAADLRDVQELFSPSSKEEPSFGIDLRQEEKAQEATRLTDERDAESCTQEAMSNCSSPELPILPRHEIASPSGISSSPSSSRRVPSVATKADTVCEEIRDLQRLAAKLVDGTGASRKAAFIECTTEPSGHSASEVRRCLADLRRQLQCLEQCPPPASQVQHYQLAVRTAAQYESEVETVQCRADADRAALRAEAREARGAAGQLLELLEASEKRNAKLEAEAHRQAAAEVEASRTRKKSQDRENTWLHAEFEQQCCRAEQLEVEVESLSCELSAQRRRLPAAASARDDQRPAALPSQDSAELGALIGELRTLQDGHHSELMVLAAVMEGLTEGEAYTQLHEQMQHQREIAAYLHAGLQSSGSGATSAPPGYGQRAARKELQEHEFLASELQQHACELASMLNGRLEAQQERSDTLETLAESMSSELAVERARQEQERHTQRMLCENALGEEEARVKRLEAELQETRDERERNGEQVGQLQNEVSSANADLREREQMVANIQIACRQSQEESREAAQEAASLREHVNKQEAQLAEMHAEVEEMRSLDVPGLHVHPLPSRSISHSGDTDSNSSSPPSDSIKFDQQTSYVQPLSHAQEVGQALQEKVEQSAEELAELGMLYKSHKEELDMFKEHAENVVAHDAELQQTLLEEQQGALSVREELGVQEQRTEELEARCCALELDLVTERCRAEGISERMAYELALERRCEQALALDVETTAREFMQLRSLQRAQVEECESLAASAQVKWEGQESELHEEASTLRAELYEKSSSGSTSAKNAELPLVAEELEEQRCQTEQLEVWLENLARELTAERHRSAARAALQVDDKNGEAAKLEAQVANLATELETVRRQAHEQVEEREAPLLEDSEEQQYREGERQVGAEMFSPEKQQKLVNELEGHKSDSERLEGWVDALARELASEHQRAEEFRLQVLTHERQAHEALAAQAAQEQQEKQRIQSLTLELESAMRSSESDALHRVLEEHQRSAFEMQAETEAKACQLTAELEGHLVQQQHRVERLEFDYMSLTEELATIRQPNTDADCHQQNQDEQNTADVEVLQLEERQASLDDSSEAPVHHQRERDLQREVAEELEEAALSSRTLTERNTQLEGRHRYDSQLVAELRKQLEQQWERAAELEASHAALECQLAAKFQQSGDQELLEAREEIQQQRQAVLELERKLESERQRAAHQEAALRAEAEEAEAIAEDLREQLGEQSKRFADAELSMQAHHLQHGLGSFARRLELSSAASMIRAVQKFYLWTWWSMCCTVVCKRRMRSSSEQGSLGNVGASCADQCCAERPKVGRVPRSHLTRAERVNVVHSMQQLGSAVGSHVYISKYLFLQIGFMAFRTQACGSNGFGPDHAQMRSTCTQRLSATLENRAKQTWFLQALLVLQRWRAHTVEMRLGATEHGLDGRVRQVAANHSTLSHIWALITREVNEAALAGLFSAWASAAGVRDGTVSAASAEDETWLERPQSQNLAPLLAEACRKRCTDKLVRHCFESWRHSSEISRTVVPEWHAIGTQPCREAMLLFSELAVMCERFAMVERARIEHGASESFESHRWQRHAVSRHQAGAAAVLMQRDHVLTCLNCFSRWRFAVWVVAAESAATSLARRAEDNCLAEVAAVVGGTAAAKPLARLLVRCDRMLMCQMCVKLWYAGVQILLLDTRLQILVHERRIEGRRQFEEAARLGLEVTAVCERLAAADRRMLHASARRLPAEVPWVDALSTCFSRLMGHTVCRESLLAWHLLAQFSALRCRTAAEMCECWAEVERQSVESQRLCTTVKLIHAQISEATSVHSCRERLVEVPRVQRSAEMEHKESTVSLLYFPPPALKLWARLCLFTWHHFMTSRTLVANMVASSEAVDADRCICKALTTWYLHTGQCQLKRHRKEVLLRVLFEMESVLLRSAFRAWVAPPHPTWVHFRYRLVGMRPSRWSIAADMRVIRCIVEEWHRSVVADHRMSRLQWVHPAAASRHIKVAGAAPRVYRAVLLPAEISCNKAGVGSSEEVEHYKAAA